MNPVWGVIRAASAYHTAPNCPEIADRITGNINKPVKYSDEMAALEAGHTQLCGACAKGILIEYEQEMYMRLTIDQLSTLKIIQGIYDRTKTQMTLSQIATMRNRKISTCFKLVNGLVRKGLVKKIYGKHGRKAVNKSIMPTELAARVLAKVPAE